MIMPLEALVQKWQLDRGKWAARAEYLRALCGFSLRPLR